MPVELKIPSVGESISEVEVGAWLKSPGDTVDKDEDLVTIESEKASVELPSPVRGTLSKILKNQGESATVGDVIAYLEEGSASATGASDSKDEDAPKKGAPPENKNASPKFGGMADASFESPKESETTGSKDREASNPQSEPTRIMPAARIALEENGLSADQVRATGPGGRVLKEDVLRHVKESKRASSESKTKEQKPIESKQPATTGDEEIVPMSMLRRTIAQRLVDAQHNAALLTTFNEIDMQAIVSLRKEHQENFQERYEIKLGFMSFFVKACVDALKQVPQLNAEIRDRHIVYKNFFDIGVAIGGGKGLVVPVLRGAERLSFAEIERAIRDFGQRAQDNRIQPDELQGGTFTISNGGVYGSLLSTPIVNPPQSGVLGLHAIQDRPVARDGQVVIRPMMYVALTYDHRIVDGREAVTFLRRIKEVIESPARMLIEA